MTSVIPQLVPLAFGVQGLALAERHIRRMIRNGRFGRFSVLEHLLLPPLLIAAGGVVYFCTDVPITEITTIGWYTLWAIAFALIIAGSPMGLVALLLMYVLWKVQDAMGGVPFLTIITAIFLGWTAGNLVGYWRGRRQQSRLRPSTHQD